MSLLEVPFSPSPSMELWLSLRNWCPIKARGKKEKQQKGIHTMKDANMLVVKMDLWLKRLDEWAHEKEAMKATVQAMDSHMTCEDCGEVGHLGYDCPDTMKMSHTSTTGSDNKIIMGGTISHARKEVIPI